MKSNSWLLFVMRSLDPVKTYRVERRAVIIVTLGGIFFLGALAFFAHQYFTLFNEKTNLMGEIGHLRSQVFSLQQKLTRVAPGKLTGTPASPPVAIEDLQILRDPKRSGFAVRFRLVPQGAQETAVSGTLVIVAKNDTLPKPVYRAIPEMPLEKGIPQRPEKGKPFEARSQKFVEAFFESASGGPFHTLTVYLYSKGGKLLLQKSAPIPKS